MVTGRSGHWEETGGADPRGAWLAAFKRFHILVVKRRRSSRLTP